MKFPLFTLVSLYALTGLSSAVVVNIDFTTSSSGGYTGLAAGPGGTHWNAVSGSSLTSLSVANLLDSQTGATTVGFSVTSFGGAINNSSNGEQERAGGFSGLMSDYIRLDTGTNTSGVLVSTTAKFTGLTVGGNYEIYFYGQGENYPGEVGSGLGPNGTSVTEGQNSLFVINGVGQQTEWDDTYGGDGLLTVNVEYVKLSAVADSSGEITFTWANVVAGSTVDGFNVVSDLAPSSSTTSATKSSRYAALNAIQIAAVPEPSAVMLGGLGILGLLVRRRR